MQAHEPFASFPASWLLVPITDFSISNYQPQEVAQLGKVYEVKQLCMGGLPGLPTAASVLGTREISGYPLFLSY